MRFQLSFAAEDDVVVLCDLVTDAVADTVPAVVEPACVVAVDDGVMSRALARLGAMVVVLWYVRLWSCSTEQEAPSRVVD
jgi:hypothetical protein